MFGSTFEDSAARLGGEQLSQQALVNSGNQLISLDDHYLEAKGLRSVTGSLTRFRREGLHLQPCTKWLIRGSEGGGSGVLFPVPRALSSRQLYVLRVYLIIKPRAFSGRLMLLVLCSRRVLLFESLCRKALPLTLLAPCTTCSRRVLHFENLFKAPFTDASRSLYVFSLTSTS